MPLYGVLQLITHQHFASIVKYYPLIMFEEERCGRHDESIKSFAANAFPGLKFPQKNHDSSYKNKMIAKARDIISYSICILGRIKFIGGANSCIVNQNVMLF